MKTAGPLGAPRFMTTLLTSSASRSSNLSPKNATAWWRRRIFPYAFALESRPIAVYSGAIATSISPDLAAAGLVGRKPRQPRRGGFNPVQWDE